LDDAVAVAKQGFGLSQGERAYQNSYREALQKMAVSSEIDITKLEAAATKNIPDALKLARDYRLHAPHVVPLSPLDQVTLNP
jgi:hypothetical protein